MLLLLLLHTTVIDQLFLAVIMNIVFITFIIIVIAVSQVSFSNLMYAVANTAAPLLLNILLGISEIHLC